MSVLRVAPVLMDRTDAELVEAVREGDDAAFAELYSRYCRRVDSYVRGMVGDRGRAEDLTQEIFIAALRRMRETVQPIAFKAWIYEIAKNACIDSFRRSRRAKEVSLDADEDLSTADRGRLTAVTTLDSAIANKQAIDDLRGAFGGLSDSHHEILVLRELEGRSYSDIGERLGMSRPVVESTLFRARRRLAEEYDELTSGRRCALVRTLVDSGPHYSLGIRDRRRMGRHLAHCQSCRAYARSASFDESILGVPRLGAKIAALLPMPLLRLSWSAHVARGFPRGRPSILAVRSVHALARSSDQLAGAGAGAGRAGAAAAALVIAGAAGGVATVTATQPGTPIARPARHATAPGSGASASRGLIAIVAGTEVRVTSQVVRSSEVRARAGSRDHAARASKQARTAGASGSRRGAVIPDSSGTAPPAGPRATGAPNVLGPVPTAAGAGGRGTPPSGSASGAGGAGGSSGAPAGGDPGGTSTGGSPTGTTGGGSPTGLPQLPTPAALSTSVPQVLSTTLNAVAGAIPRLPTTAQLRMARS